jgi:hypothetical protein
MTLRTWNRISLKEIKESDTVLQILFAKWRGQLLFDRDLRNQYSLVGIEKVQKIIRIFSFRRWISEASMMIYNGMSFIA